LNPTIRHITFDCTGEPYELARFWSEFLGHPISDIDKPGDDEVLLELPDGSPGLLFVRVEEAKSAKNRMSSASSGANGIEWSPDRLRHPRWNRAVVSSSRPTGGQHPWRRQPSQ
jgi:hypothetical protein